ncbi:MAG: ATP-binding cassette domain-containing protein [Holosporaceae bacterium]|jgi:excinuclease ABC subunit A|nr:ATP-binding cassette domain-containing protein [Holosporaceae bacterium]
MNDNSANAAKNSRLLNMPQFIEIRGARVNNLKNIDVDIPLGKIVGICGVSGSGKSSLALGVLYSEGFRKYLSALSAYSKRRIAQPKKAKIDSIRFLPSTIALRQRPAIPGIRSTVGTMTETLNVVRLMFSRLGSHPCPNGHLVDSSLEFVKTEKFVCPQCGARFDIPDAESFSFNSGGACAKCEGLGVIRVINPKKLVPNEDLTVEQGAVSPWRMMGRTLNPLIAKELGVRIDVPYKDLTDEEKHILLRGEEGIHQVIYTNEKGKAIPLNINYENAYLAVINSSKSSSDITLAKAERYYDLETCPECHGSRINARTAASRLAGYDISKASALSIKELYEFAEKVAQNPTSGLEKIANELLGELYVKLDILSSLGVSYLAIDRLGNSLSNGELQRIQLAKIIQNDTTGVLYVFDEPSIGLHPINIEGLAKSIKYLVDNGNTVVLVDHNTLILKEADYLIEMGRKAGEEGGRVMCLGTPKELAENKDSIIGKYLCRRSAARDNINEENPFEFGVIELGVKEKFNIKNLTTKFPVNKLTVVAGVSGSGKTTLVLECLVEAVKSQKEKLPDYVSKLDASRVKNAQFIDASPIGKNSRSTVATYTGVFDLIRKLFANTDDARAKGYTESWFSYNNVQGRCSTCEGLGEMDIDIQYLPDLTVPCPDCGSARYNSTVLKVKYDDKSIADVLALTVHEAIEFFKNEPNIQKRLINMEQIGLGYLTLGEGTPELSGGEAQRMRLSMETNKVHDKTLFVLDEPTIGLHPKDVEVLISNLRILISKGATIVVIEHDADIIRNADYVVEMGEKGGPEGGKIIASGTVSEILRNPRSVIAKWLT